MLAPAANGQHLAPLHARDVLGAVAGHPQHGAPGKAGGFLAQDDDGGSFGHGRSMAAAPMRQASRPLGIGSSASGVPCTIAPSLSANGHARTITCCTTNHGTPAMLTFLPSPDDVIAVTEANKITGEDFDQMLERLESKLATHDKVHVFAEAISIDGIEVSGLGSRLARAMPLMGKLRRFGRVAVVADQAW